MNTNRSRQAIGQGGLALSMVRFASVVNTRSKTSRAPEALAEADHQDREALRSFLSKKFEKRSEERSGRILQRSFSSECVD